MDSGCGVSKGLDPDAVLQEVTEAITEGDFCYDDCAEYLPEDHDKLSKPKFIQTSKLSYFVYFKFEEVYNEIQFSFGLF